VHRRDRPPLTVEADVEVAGAEILEGTSLAVDDLDVDEDPLDAGPELRLLRRRDRERGRQKKGTAPFICE
jgi:hypothetical protein